MLALLLLGLSALAGTLKVHVIDVGQGDAILIESPEQKRVLIDAATAGAKVADKLIARGVTRLDLAVSTHPHADHIGGMADVLKKLEVGRYMDNGQTHTTLTYARTMGLVEKKEVGYVNAVNGRTLNLGGEVKMTILHPGNVPMRGTRSDLNSNSVVIRLDHKNNCFLFTGDAEAPTEVELMRRGIEPCDVLKVAHHGSEHSSQDAFLRAVQPKYAAISAGVDNRYGHPDPEALGRFKRAEIEVYRTDLSGTITFTSDGSTIKVTTEREGTDPFAGATLEAGGHPVAMHANAPSASPVGSTININTADAATLDQLPGVGPSKASAIVAFREANGPFAACSDLQRVAGIGPKTVEKIGLACTTKSTEEKK